MNPRLEGSRAAVALVTATRAVDRSGGDAGEVDDLLRGYVRELEPDQLHALLVTLIVMAANPMTDSDLSQFGHEVA